MASKSRDKSASAPDEPKKDGDKKSEEPTSSFSYFTLFRYATKGEILLNILGLAAAIVVGTAQPLLSLVFSRLASSFVGFGIAAGPIKAGNPTAEQQAAFDAAKKHFRSQAANDALYLVYIGIGAFVLSYFYMSVWVRNGEAIARRVREQYFRAVLRQDIAFFDTSGAGAITTRITTDTHLIQTGISEKVALVVQYTSAFISGFVIAYIRSWRLALPMSSILPGIMLSGAVMGGTVGKLKTQSLKHIADGGSLAEGVFSTIRTSKAFGTQTRLAKVYNTHMTASYVLDRRSAWFSAGGFGWFMFVLFCGYALAFWYGTTLVLKGHANIGTIVNVLMSILYGSVSLMFIIPELSAISSARGAGAKIFETIDRVPSIDSSNPSGSQPASVTGAIALSDVHLTYPSRPDVPVLKGISLAFAPGKTSALVGASGCGKSSIISLLERFYDPSSGSVMLDGVDVRELNIKWLRSQIGLVGQEPVLFSTTVRQNVEYGLAGSTKYAEVGAEERARLVESALKLANAWEFVTGLPEGLETRVGERGFLLSGGQKQRIAIARAVVGDPAILLLDEATSALDTHSEGIVQDALNKASEGRTVIAVAHRLSTIQHAHCIFVLGEGKLLEQGSHTELLRNEHGVYSQLVLGQKLREAQEKEDVTDLEGKKLGLGASRSVTPLPSVAASEELETENGAMVRTKTLPYDEAKGTAGPKVRKEYGGWELFTRMAKINQDVTNVYLLGIVAALVAGMIFPVFAIVYGITIGGFQTTDRHQLRQNGNHAALHFFILALANWLSVTVQQATFQAGASALTWKLRQMCFRSIVSHDVGWFDDETHATGILVSNLADAPLKFFGLAGGTLGSIFASSATLFGGWIVALVYCWKLGLIGICTSPILFSLGYLRLRIIGLRDQKNKNSHASSARIACEAADSIKTVASLTLEADLYTSYSTSLDGPMAVTRRTTTWSSLVFGFVQAFLYVSMALAFWYGSRLVSNLEFSTQHYFTAMMCITLGAMQAGNAFNFAPDISHAKGAAGDMMRLMDERPVVEPDIGTSSPEALLAAVHAAKKKADLEQGIELGKMPVEDPVDEKVMGRVEMRDVRFSYPTRPHQPVLRGLSLVAEPGQYVAIVGPSGSGKSTVVQMIERFYHPQSGELLLDNKDVNSIPMQKYRSKLALVSQEPSLYAGSIRFNILLGAAPSPHEGIMDTEDTTVSEEDIERACRDANILDFIKSLPDGFDTDVGSKGTQLSGGQKQRIAIARALVRNPTVLLLDEATSALDSTSEKVVQEALDNAAKGRTTISIAHRLSTIQNADRIYYVREGRVIESGTHDELLELKGGYYELVQLQALTSEE